MNNKINKLNFFLNDLYKKNNILEIPKNLQFNKYFSVLNEKFNYFKDDTNKNIEFIDYTDRHFSEDILYQNLTLFYNMNEISYDKIYNLSESLQMIKREMERYRETLKEKEKMLENVEIRNKQLESTQTSLVQHASKANDVQLTARDMAESVRKSLMEAKTASLEAALARYSSRCLRALIPEESTRVEVQSIETLVLLRGVRGKIIILEECLLLGSNQQQQQQQQQQNDSLISHPYRILCAPQPRGKS